ncbi:MAG TPA: FAD-dependent monooxygenase [Rhodocyclaceae bacterium]|nr:FAD-dependent monooxygenase [Rhodocyclaceae bacterium]
MIERTHHAPPVAIVGGGPVGMTLGLALAAHGIRASIHDARPRGAARHDKRAIALSHGSRQILEWLGVWQQITATPIRVIHVSQQGGFGRTRITAEEQGVAALGYVATATSINTALDDALTARNIEFHGDNRVEHVETTAQHVTLHCTSGTTTTPLVVYAEGAINADAAATVNDYGQHAVICTVTPDRQHGNIAFERFTPQGPLALLPCGNEFAVVYPCPADKAAFLVALPDEKFLGCLQNHFGKRLGFSAVTPRHVFPLSLRYRNSPVDVRSVWLGNAAQTLHPVAGQGFNLALRDVWELASTLADTDNHAADPGGAALLARYAAARHLDRRSAIGFTDMLVRTFSNDTPPLRTVRGIGLCMLDILSPLRGFVARRMMYGARAWP